MITRDAFLDFGRQTSFDRMDVPGLGEIYLRKLSGAGRDRYIAAMAREPEHMSAVMIADCVCDENGKRVFTQDDIPQIAQMPMRVLQLIVDRIDQNNKIGPVDEDIESAEKNSEAAPSD